MASLTSHRKKQGGWPPRARMVSPFLLAMAFGLAYIQVRAQAPFTGKDAQQNRLSIASEDNARIAAEAREALRKRDYSSAVEKLERLVKIAPGMAEVHANLATAYYSVGRFDDAAQQARAALELKSSLTNAHFFLGLSLAESDRCKEALPYLYKDYPRVPDPELKHAIGTDAVRCAMDLDEPDKAVDLLRSLSRDFPDDPDLLYLSSHVYSDLSTRASQHLLVTAPGSYQAHQFNAEVLDLEGKLGDASEEYHKVLSLRPNLPGIHYQLGKLSLAGAPGPKSLDEARREFAEELRIDPRNAAAEYELGEIARRARQWNDAIEHFQRAAGLDPQFAEALIGLGKSLVSAGRTQEAVRPLERAVNLAPDNPNAHYQLSFAYRRLGRDQEAGKELAAYRNSRDKLLRSMQSVRTGILGNIAQPQTDSPPD